VRGGGLRAGEGGGMIEGRGRGGGGVNGWTWNKYVAQYKRRL